MMADNFEQVLDECIDRIIVRGETVDDCMAHYPGHADELRQYLPLAVKTARAYAFSPGKAAKDLGRQKLQAELQVLEEADARKKSGARRRSMSFGWQLRWATALVASAIIVVLGGASTALASRNALPGDMLYPIKLAAEKGQLAVEFSETGKAQLHITYAERRAGEIGSLLEEGESSQLAPTQKRLVENLEASARIVKGLKDEDDVDRLTSELGATASQALAGLQTVLQTVPDTRSEAAADILRSSSDAYSHAIEAAAQRSPKPLGALAMGRLEIRATDPPLPGVKQLLLEVGKIEVHPASGQGSRWVTVTEEPQVFDLLRLAEVQRFLGEKVVEPGLYTKVRFQITKATVVTDSGEEKQARVPSGSMDLARPFRVEEGKTTTIFLDFNGERSLKVTGQQDYVIVPQLTVLVKEPDRKASQPGKEPEKKQEGRRGEEKSKTDGTPGTKPAETRIELEGVTEGLSSDSLVVRGKQVVINPDTVIQGAAEAGKKVVVDAVTQPDGSLVASRVRQAKDGEQEQKPKSEDRDDGKERTPEPATVHFIGRVDVFGPARWDVGEQKIIIDQNTQISGTPAAGVLAEVEGERQPDGTVRATSIKVLGKAQPSRPGAGRGETQPPRNVPQDPAGGGRERPG